MVTVPAPLENPSEPPPMAAAKFLPVAVMAPPLMVMAPLVLVSAEEPPPMAAA